MAKKLYEESNIQAIADAIRGKNGTTDTYKVSEMAGAIEAIEAGGGAATQKQSGYCTFYDYDGTVVEAWSKEELENATSLPNNPTHKGLISQGWNWTLEDLKNLGRECETGQLYVTDDGKTRIYITLGKGRTSPMLGCCPNGTVTVDWGDGTTPDILTGTSTGTTIYTPVHNYKNAGDYVITLTVDGKMSFYSSTSQSTILVGNTGTANTDKSYLQSVRKIEIGANITFLGMSAFCACYSLETVTMPANVSISQRAFMICRALKCIVAPKKGLSDYVFQYGYALRKVILASDETSIPTGFAQSSLISNQVIPNTVKSIGNSAFNGCSNLTYLTIPEATTAIKRSAFQSCYLMKEFHIKPTTPPTVENQNAFSGIPVDCIMYVPDGAVEAYKTATNWSTYASQIKGISELPQG